MHQAVCCTSVGTRWNHPEEIDTQVTKYEIGSLKAEWACSWVAPPVGDGRKDTGEVDMAEQEIRHQLDKEKGMAGGMKEVGNKLFMVV